MNIGFSFVSFTKAAVQQKPQSTEAAGSIAMFTPASSSETAGSVASSSGSSCGSSFSCVA